VSYHFPDYPDRKLPMGEEITALISFNNAGDRVLNVSYVGAQLHSPYDLAYFIQNYTAKEIWTTVLPQSEITLEYKFTPDDSLEALEFWLSGYVFYNSTDDLFAYRHTWANSTIELAPGRVKFDPLSLLTYVTVLVCLAAMGYGAYTFSGVKKKVEKAKKVPRTITDADWGISTYKPAEGAKKQPSKKFNQKKSAPKAKKA
jgi:hypothetical protein